MPSRRCPVCFKMMTVNFDGKFRKHYAEVGDTVPCDAAGLTPTDILDGLTPTEYLVLDVMVARYRLGDDGWTFPTQIGPALARLATRGYVDYKSGVVQNTLQVWFTDKGASFSKLDQPYVIYGEQRGRVWEADEGVEHD
jgi:hypothetical protein